MHQVLGLRISLLQVRKGMQFPRNETPNSAALWSVTSVSKSLTSTESRYSTIERESLGILHCLEKFHHYCFACEVIVITNHKALMEIFRKI